jgi:oxygen-independent coproporphyrinogen-3 oxidase
VVCGHEPDERYEPETEDNIASEDLNEPKIHGFEPVFPVDTEPMGLYIHVPFCTGRCNYCSFVSFPYDSGTASAYADAVVREIHLRAEMGRDRAVYNRLTADTIYFGGGTPSLLSASQIERIVHACRSAYRGTDIPEITLEVNPGGIDRHDFTEMRQLGVNRISLGIQSAHDDELTAMGRRHTTDEAFRTYDAARQAGLDNVSVDLVAGYPGQTLGSFMESLRTVVNLSPEHISVYLLEVKEGTQLEQAIRGGLVPAPDDDLQADMYEALCETLTSSGYEHYEISNFAKPHRQARHNLKYWHDSIYLGFGAGAHGMTGRARYANTESLSVYMRLCRDQTLPEQTLYNLSPMDRLKDALIMGLRLRQGLDIKVMSERYGADVERMVRKTIGDCEEQGLIYVSDRALSLTKQGLLLSNTVFSRWV